MIISLGYYDRGNLGDELFKESLNRLFISEEIEYKNPYDVEKLSRYEMVFFGPGNVMNEYFLKRLDYLKKLNSWMSEVPLVCVGVGFESKELPLNLSQFNYILTRTSDKYLLQNLHNEFNIRSVMCMPDVVFSLLDVNVEINQEELKKVAIIGSQDRIKTSSEEMYIMDTKKDKLLSCKTLESIEDFKTKLSKYGIVISYKFHGIVLSVMYNKIPISDMCSYKCLDLMYRIFGDHSKNLMFKSSSLNKDIESILRYVRSNKRIIYRKMYIYRDYVQKFYKCWDSEYVLNRFRITFEKDKLKLSNLSSRELQELFNLGGNSKYLWGIKHLSIVAKENIKWLSEELLRKEKECRPYNIKLKDQSFSEDTHRYGWNYVLSQLRMISSSKGIFLDTYLDSSYDGESYLFPWIGIIHHPDGIAKEYSEASMSRIFKSNFWYLSRPYCECLIFLSTYAKEQALKYVESRLLRTVYHPMSQLIRKWNYIHWKMRGEKLYMLGSWLRNEFAIYELNYKNKNVIVSSSNIPPSKLYIYKKESINLNVKKSSNKSLSCCSSDINNKWVYFANEYLSSYDMELLLEEREGVRMYLKEEEMYKKIKSVRLEDRKSNKSYDDMLSSSIVLLDLIECSACNVLLECIMGEVPIYVKYHKAISEYLGEDYPLYYDKVSNLIIDESKIKIANKYLRKLNKEKFSSDYFIKSMLKIKSEIK